MGRSEQKGASLAVLATLPFLITPINYLQDIVSTQSYREDSLLTFAGNWNS